MVTREDIKAINNVILMERETGHCLFDFDDYYHDMIQMAEILGIKMFYNEEEEEWMFHNAIDQVRTKTALSYYYERS